jgi:hypothetical protein
MLYEFRIGPFIWRYQTDEKGLTARSGPYVKSVAWEDVIAAGLSPKKKMAIPRGFPVTSRIFPGLEKLAPAARNIQASTELILIAYRPRARGRKLLTLNILNSGELRDSFVNELRERLRGRWLGEGINLLELRQTLGFSNRWIMPAMVAGMALVALTMFGWWYLQSRFWIFFPIVGFLTYLVYRWRACRR